MTSTKEKTHDYKRIVILQGIIVVLGLTLSEGLALIGIDHAEVFIQTVFIAFGGVYLYLLWDMLRNFTRKKKLIRGVLVAIIVLFAVGAVAENPYIQLIEHPRPYLLFVHLLLLLIEILIIAFAIRDIFTSTVMNVTSLWGAACVFLMMGIAFGSLYDFINIIHPGAFGVNIALGYDSYSESIYHSMCIMGGVSSVYANPVKLIRNISVIESVWFGLYLVLLIGRLLGMGSGSK